jgi:hypothetical protein
LHTNEIEEPGLRAAVRRIGSRMLGEFPHAVVRIECECCARAGTIAWTGLLARFGADIALPNLLVALRSAA